MTATGARARLRMTPQEVASYLQAMRRVQVGTLNPDGSVHLVPMSYLLWDGEIGLWTDPASRKARNLRADPRITALVEDGASGRDYRAVQLRGRAEVIADLDTSRRAGELLFERHRPNGLDEAIRAEAAALAPARALVLIHAESVISWDHRKLAGAGLEDIGR